MKESLSVARIRSLLPISILIAFSFGYLLQVFSPLRINTDSYRLLSMAVSAFEGKGFLVDGNRDQYPLGYPLVLLTLLKTCLANSVTLVGVNLIALVLGMYCFWRISEAVFDSKLASIAAVVSMASWVMIKHVTLPISDLLFFGVSAAALFCALAFWQSGYETKWGWLAAAALLAILSLQIRTAGLALFPPLVIGAVVQKNRLVVPQWFARFKWTLIGGGLAISMLSAFWVTTTGWFESQFIRNGSYFSNFTSSFSNRGVLSQLLEIVYFRLLEFGEIALNLPSSKVPALLPVLLTIGMIGWIALAYGSWILRKKAQPIILYLSSYCALLFLWPAFDARFWLPVLPIIGLCFIAALTALARRAAFVRGTCWVYLITFVSLGVIALALSTRASLSGRDFGEFFGDGSSTMTYRYALQSGKAVDEKNVDFRKVRLLRIFDSRARKLD
jgi:hypothetical protein